MIERWLPVVGWEGCYEVSDMGRVRSLPRLVAGRYGSQRLAPGRLRSLAVEWNKEHDLARKVLVTLKRDGIGKTILVGRLVLEAFVGPAPEGFECCHGDGDAQNNWLTNLRWDTHVSNVEDMVRHGRANGPRNPARGARQHSAYDLTNDDIRCIRAEPDFRGVCHMLARAFGVTYLAIWRIRRGINWVHVPQYL